MIDLSDDSFLTAFDTLSHELEAFSPILVDKPRLILGTKLDLEGTSDRLEELRARYPDEQVIGVSVFSGEGLDAVSEAFSRMVNELDVAEESRK